MKNPTTETKAMLTVSPAGEAPFQESESVETRGDPPEPSLSDPQRLNRALERHRAELEAIEPEDFVNVNVSIPEAAMLVLNATKRWALYKQRIDALSTEVNCDQIGKIAGFARATLQANANLAITSAPENELHATLQRGIKLGERLSTETKVLVRRGLLPSKSLVQLDRTTGYRAVATELTALATLLGNNWASVAGKTAITLEELDEANLIANKIFEDAAERDRRHPEVVQARKLRMQAFTAMVRAYEEMRRCLAFIEPKRLDDLAPPLTQVRGQGNGTQPNEPDAAEPDATPEPLANGQQGPGVPQGNGTAATATPGAGDTLTATTGPGGLVLPNPFR